MQLPRHILERVERLYSYHQRTKIMAMGTRVGAPADPQYRPTGPRVFADAPKIPLPTTLLDASIGMLTLLNVGQDALPESLRAPPQDLKTLASWLYYGAGETKRVAGGATTWTRAFCEADAAFGFEVYVAVFSIDGLEPGLYHFSAREFALRKLRDGVSALMQIKKGRPDMEFLKTLPAALLVSGRYWPSVWRQGRRGYRQLCVEVGQAVQNLVIAGAGLGAQTMTRLRMNDSTMRELIGVKLDEPLGGAESVHAMVAWADPAVTPIQVPQGGAAPAMSPLPREAVSKKVLQDEATSEPLFIHQDCVAPGVAVRELRPPLTELSPLPANYPPTNVKLDEEPDGGLPVRQVMLERRAKSPIAKSPITRMQLLSINKVAFRGGSFFPMIPDGRHVATARPFWIVNDVTGIDKGIWYYDPMSDRWSILRGGNFRREAKYVAGDRDAFGDAAAVCIVTANLHVLMTQGGPDAYRLAHLEAGVVSQRIYLGATSLGLSCVSSQEYYDEDCRALLGLDKTGWEVLHVMGIGARGGGGVDEGKVKALGQVLGLRD